MRGLLLMLTIRFAARFRSSSPTRLFSRRVEDLGSAGIDEASKLVLPVTARPALVDVSLEPEWTFIIELQDAPVRIKYLHRALNDLSASVTFLSD